MKETESIWKSPRGHVFTYERLSNQTTKLTRDKYSVFVSSKGLYLWQTEGWFIQNALPELSADDREFLLTGMTPAQQKALYGA